MNIQRTVYQKSGANDTSMTLEELYKSLNDNTVDGFLSLAPGALAEGPMEDFFQKLSLWGDGFTLNEAEIAEPSEDNVTVTGYSDVLSLSHIAVTLVFTLDGKILVCQCTLAMPDLLWALPSVPWFAFSDPDMTLFVRDDSLPTQYGVSGLLKLGTEVRLGMSTPALDNQWLITADFPDHTLALSNVFALAGGINLIAQLPPAIQAFTDLAVEHIAISYDAETKSVSSMSLVIGTQGSWHVFGKVNLTGLAINCTILSPGNVAQRGVAFTFSSTFAIGEGALQISATYPDFTLYGALAEDSPAPTISDVVTMFIEDASIPLSGTVSNFSMYVKPGNSPVYDVSCGLDVPDGWTIGVFSITSLSLAVSGMAKKVSATLGGTLVILAKSPNAITLALSASYATAQGWTFTGAQTSGAVPLGDLLHEYLGWDTQANFQIDGLGFSISTKGGDWSFSGKTAEPWKVPFIPELTVSASLKAGYIAAASTTKGQLRLVGGTAVGRPNEETAGHFARLETDWTWQGIDIKVWFDYNPKVNSFGITWGVLQGSVTGPDKTTGDYVALLTFTDNVTLGSVIETMVTWLTGTPFSLDAPWNVLDSIKLSNVGLKYIFNSKDKSRNKVTFNVKIGPIDLGFARIDGIDIGYQSKGPDRGVMVTLNGFFPWNIGNDAVGDVNALGPWDTSKPGTAPAPSGNGNKYFDLRLLALGQHVTAPGFATAETVQQAIAVMRDLPDPEDGKIPLITFDGASDWLVGMEFGVLKLGDNSQKKTDGRALTHGVPELLGEQTEAGNKTAANGYFLTMQVVFNDPHIYGLRIALEGEPAKIFKGLDFQIMYRQISDTVGVYQAEIALPDVMRFISVGAYSITLPVFAIAIYTNGDFQVDIGFPWNADFSRSFSIEAIIYPGIPVLGSAGFYFGKLSSATTKRVPQITNGTFNPVLVFGFGLQLGFGKSIRYGILSAGFSLTAVGILEGVIAKFNPYQLTGPDSNNKQVQGAYYFWLRGTVGIIGKVFGTVDFAIIKANVNIEVRLLLELSYESYVSIAMTVLASVDVSVSVKIDLGLFSISIHFSFSMRLKETFTIKNGGTAPWLLADGSARSLRGRSPERRLRALRAVPQSVRAPVWSNLQAATSKAPLSGYASVGLTMARDEWGGAQQLPCYVAMLFIDSVAAANVDRTSAALKAAGGQDDSSFETLAKMVLRWAVAALHDGPVDAATLDATPVSDALLADLADLVLASNDNNPAPIDADDFATFLAGQFEFTVGLPPTTQGEATAAFFPIPGAARLSIPAYGSDYPGVDYSFGDYNEVSEAALSSLRSYFDDLAIKVQQESGAPVNFKSARTGQTLSMAEWIFADYALLLARQMVQAVREALRDYKYLIEPGKTADQIVTWVNQNQGTGHDLYERNALFASNANHPLTVGKSLTVGLVYNVSGQYDSSFAQVAAEAALGAYGAFAIATANADVSGLLKIGSIVTYPDKPDYPVQAGDSLLAIARQFSVLLTDLLNHGSVLAQAGLLIDSAALRIPVTSYQSQTGDSFTGIAGLSLYSGSFDARNLALVNSGQAILRPGATITYPSLPPLVVQPRDTLGDLANRLKNVSLAQLIENSDLLTRSDMFLPVARLVIPLMVVNVGANATLDSTAQFFGVSVQTLAETDANGSISDLFATQDGTGKACASLDIAHLPAFTLSELIAEAQRSHALQHLSGMASRYYLHGLRLQTDHIVPKKPGIWVRSGNNGLELPKLVGLFALTGQQFPLPVIQSSAPFSLSLETSAALPWLKFQDTSKAPTDSLNLSIAAGTDDANRISSLMAYATTSLDIALERLGPATMAQSKPATYACSAPTTWQCAGAVSLPYGVTPSGIAAMRLWRLPDALCALPDPASRAIDPRLAVKLAQYDEASGSTNETSVNAYGWASTLSFTVKKVPPVVNSPASATTYEIVGADGTDITLLERLVNYVKDNNSAFHSLAIGYAPDQSGPATQGIETAAPLGVTLGIAQVNLSTETRPPAQAFNALLRQDSGLGLLNEPSKFVRLLWEASITRSGGFFLYYYDAQQRGGLPERLFNERGEATLSLILIYSKPLEEAKQDRVSNYMNTLVTADAFDAANTTLYAEANPPSAPQDTYVTSASDTLGSIAYRYFSDAGELAETNAGLMLAKGTTLNVGEGIFRVPPGPALALAAIAQRFGCSVAALQGANANRLTDPLSYPAVARLPLLAVTVSDTQNTTLEEIAAFYGQSVIALAGQNLSLTGLFQGQTLNISGGPNLRSASVPPGVVSMAALRAVPPEVPLKPNGANDADYAKALLLNVYNLLNYKVAANSGFDDSHLGLPAGPTTRQENPQSQDKVAIPRTLVPGDKDWNYQQAVPFAKFARQGPVNSPYRGIGEVLQVDFNWQDFYGNTLLTTLSDPTAQTTRLNYPPLLMGYSDALIGLGQWPSISSNWQVLPDTVTNARLQLNLSFDNSQFQGVLLASATGPVSVLVRFTEPLVAATANNITNYRLDDGNVLSATLQTDNRSVLLSVDTLAQDSTFTLYVNDLSTTDQRTISGQAGFSYPDQPQLRSSSVQQSAVRALRVFSQLQLQLNDPNGISWNLETSLLQPDTAGASGSLAIPASQISSLLDWLFGSTSILAMLTDRAAFGMTVGLPGASLTLVAALPLNALNTAQIFALELGLRITRSGGNLLDELATVTEIRSSSTSLTPYQSAVSGSANTLVLDTFAKDLTLALALPGIQFSLATGVDRYASTYGNRTLWVVRVGHDKPQAISYAITGNPSIFAPQPISNTLESRTQVPIYDYVTGSGISQQASRTLDFIDIDLDAWGQQLFKDVDNTLTPSFTGAMEILARFKNSDYLGQLLTAKKAIANIAKLWMMPVFEGDDSDPKPAQEAFYQQLLGQLTNAYTVRASIGYKAQVNAAVSVPAPRLFGAVVPNPRFIAGVVSTSDPTRVTLYFNIRLAATAIDTQFYSLAGGPQVLSAALSSDGTQVTLTLAAAAEPRQELLVSKDLTDAQGYGLKPPYSQPLTSKPPTLLPDGITLSSPKLELAESDDSPLVFLVSAPDLVRGNEGEIVKSIDLDLRFQASDIEHQIGSLTGILGYQPSSWLRFVIPPQAAPLNADLGAVSVPLVLRTFPTTPTLTTQKGATNDSATDLASLVLWTYSFTYALPFHYPQDRVYGNIAFNAAKSGQLKAFQDAFAPLAEFVTVYPAVYEDLEIYLAGIDATTDPVKDAQAIENAGVALDSAISLLNGIVDAASGSGLIMASRTRDRDAEDPLAFSFYIEEDDIDYEGTQGALRVSLVGQVPPGLGTPQVEVASQLYMPIPLKSDDINRLSFVYRNIATPTQYLSASEGQAISDRKVIVPGANILQRQSTTTSLYLKRNQELIPGRPSAKAFIYQTPEVKFSNPLFPQADSSQRIPIEQLGAGAPGTIHVRALAEQLQTLFDTLLAGSSQPSITVQVETTYRYSLNSAIEAIQLPILMQAPLSVALTDLPNMVNVWSSAIETWFNGQPPCGDDGTLWFDLSLMSDLTGQAMPLLRLRKLSLTLPAIQPALPVT